MDYMLLGTLVAVIAFGIGWWWLARRRKALVDSQRRERDEGVPETFDRSMLVSRPQTFDPTAWDNTPDEPASKPARAPKSKRPEPPTPAPSRPYVDEGGGPVVLDRAFLESRRRPADPDAATPE